MEISLEALTERARRAAADRPAPPRALIGKSTVDAIRCGDRLRLRRAGRRRSSAACAAELGDETETIATGGLAAHIVPFTETIDEIDDLLTLTGLRLIC